MGLLHIERQLARIADAQPGNIEFDTPAQGPDEIVIVFNADPCTVKLIQADGGLSWKLDCSTFTTLSGSPVAPPTSYTGSFPVDPKTLPDIFAWPPPGTQSPPYDDGIIDPTVAKAVATMGPAKENVSFADGSSVASAGPSLARITKVGGGNAGYFWATTAALITNGTGKYKGARGLSTLFGGAYLKKLPDLQNPPPPVGFTFPLSTIIVLRLVLAESLKK